MRGIQNRCDSTVESLGLAVGLGHARGDKQGKKK
jgi:hypothetical protein